MRSIFTALVLAVVLSGCATRPKQYSAPDPAKMNVSSQRLGTAVTKARATASKARSEVSEAAATSKPVKEKLVELKKVVPLEHASAVSDIQVAHEITVLKLDEAIATQTTLDKELQEAEAAKQQLQSDQAQYVTDAGKLAEEATAERNKRIKVEKALSWYRWHWWAAWVVAGAGIVICIILAITKFAGKLML